MYDPAETRYLCFVAIHYHHNQSKTRLGHEHRHKKTALSSRANRKRAVEVATFNFIYQISQFFAVKIAVNQEAHPQQIFVK